jgi:ATP-dependent protease ClpP protease subunit
MSRKKKEGNVRGGESEHPLMSIYTPEDFHDYRVNREGFVIYVGGEHSQADDTHVLDEPGVEYRMADRFEGNLDMLSGIDPNRPILVKISSCGGYWEPGMQMFGAILTCPNPITVLDTKWARSMTSIIPLAADKFVMREPAQYMYHRGTFAFSGLDQEAETANEERVRANEIMYRIYTTRLLEQGKFSNWSEKRVRAMLEQKSREKIDTWLTATEAKKWGFVDEIYDGNPNTLRATVKNETRRAAMMETLKKPVRVNVKVSR